MTASHREQTVESVPYSLSVVGGEELARNGVTDIASLTAQVPGLSTYDFGARTAGSSFPIIRGINASEQSTSGFRTNEQAPVGTYIGNSPIDGYFQLDDISRIEVLRGPQGTLYGAGALGGAIRIVPNAPELGRFTAKVEVGGGSVAHSDSGSYTASMMLNVPVGDALAFRVSGRYEYLPGFIKLYGILERGPGPFAGIPLLANPADPVNSPGIFTGAKDWNDQKTLTGRASLLWQPADSFRAELAFTYSKLDGDGGPVENFAFNGGPYVIDPRVSFPAGGDYRAFSTSDQPYSRKTSLASLDLGYDMGFATVSATSSYYRTTGSTLYDATYGNYNVNGVFAPYQFVQYYAGNPINPRYVQDSLLTDAAHTFTQEVRLVSASRPEKHVDYVVGLFYEDQTRDGTWYDGDPGSPERAIAQGCTAPFFNGASFPDCLPGYGPGDVNFVQPDSQQFNDKSVFGELTWHFTRHAQITFGGRHSQQDFTDTQAYLLYSFAILVPPAERSTSLSKNVWKIDTSYEYSSGHFAYALWSQGFRRGGANAFPSAGIFYEPPSLTLYAPDSVDNYEAGVKGRFAYGMTYALAVFDDEWDKPQVGGALPGGNVGVWNANKARSRGVELNLTTPLFSPSWTLAAAAAYTDARFTEDYSLSGGRIFGLAGEQLPGSAKASAAGTLTYQHSIGSNYQLVATLNDTYRSAFPLNTYPKPGERHLLSVSGINILNLSASVRHLGWDAGVYVTNVADRHVIISPGITVPPVDITNGLAQQRVINEPREISVRLGYAF